jgi:hypothetical protein
VTHFPIEFIIFIKVSNALQIQNLGCYSYRIVPQGQRCGLRRGPMSSGCTGAIRAVASHICGLDFNETKWSQSNRVC